MGEEDVLKLRLNHQDCELYLQSASKNNNLREYDERVERTRKRNLPVYGEGESGKTAEARG